MASLGKPGTAVATSVVVCDFVYVGNQKGVLAVNANCHCWSANLVIASRHVAQNKVTGWRYSVGGDALFEVLSSVFRSKIPQRSRILSSICTTMEFSRSRVKNHRFSITRFLPLPSTPHRSQSPQSSSTIRAHACSGSNSSTTGLLGGTKTGGFCSCSSSQVSHSGRGTLAKTPPGLPRC